VVGPRQLAQRSPVLALGHGTASAKRPLRSLLAFTPTPTRSFSPTGNSNMKTSEKPKSGRGFAGMDASRQREIASKGGKAAHAQGRAHEFTAEEARVAGRKGGAIVSGDRAHMVTIGRTGGLARGRAHPERRRTTGPTKQLASGAE
jgi:general stress protein YciG